MCIVGGGVVSLLCCVWMGGDSDRVDRMLFTPDSVCVSESWRDWDWR